MYILQVIWKYFFSTKSAAEHGTLYQLRNLVHRTNVVSDPAKDFNACDDFIVLVVTCHILAASLEVFGMKSLSDTPVLPLLPPELENEPENLWMLVDSERKRVLDHITGAVVDRFIDFQFHADTQRSEDSVQDYAIQLLSLGCFYLEYADAIREGDGDRVLRCWRYLLPIFKSSGRTNYSIEALSFLHQYQYLLTPRQSAELLWNRFVNVHGVRGRNIPCDLHLEHLNRVCKNAISDLGVNKTEKAIKRVGNVLGTLYPVLQQFDSDNHIRGTSGTHRMPSSERDRDRIIHELQQSNVFSSIPSRTHHQSFPKPRHVLHDYDYEKIHKWIIEHI